MKNILITAAGTASAWHIASTIRSSFSRLFKLFACDINPSHLIPASKLADTFFKVPLISDSTYEPFMLDLLRKNRIDILVPLIDSDLVIFPRDRKDLLDMGTFSTGPVTSAAVRTNDKKGLFSFLRRNHFPVPGEFDPSNVKKSVTYFIKPRQGYGSRGARTIKGDEISALKPRDWIIQEKCSLPEITVEVFCYKGRIETVCRERIDTKAGVCVKARVFRDKALHKLVERLAEKIAFPEASCIQVMKSPDSGDWVITDVNLRIGAGTALSAAAGWDLTSSALSVWGRRKVDPFSFMGCISGEIYVARVYSEIVMK